MNSTRGPVVSKRRLAAALLVSTLLAPGALDAEHAVFRSPSRTVSLFVLPGETVAFDLASYAGLSPRSLERFAVEPDSALTVSRAGKGGFAVVAPSQVGIYGATFRERSDRGLPGALPYRLQVVVLRPAEEAVGGILNGYPVGSFPESRDEERWRFESPRGFVEITPENLEIPLSDHFTLGELDCKFQAPYPHYAALQTSLLVKLEGIADVLNQRGLPGDHIEVLSGFRTPDYNRALGNETVHSRHIVGDAADIFVDQDRDGRMDDLNGDGRVNRRDAKFLLALVAEMDESPEYGVLVGGASAYPANTTHGPFLHLDTRGYPARW